MSGEPTRYSDAAQYFPAYWFSHRFNQWANSLFGTRLWIGVMAPASVCVRTYAPAHCEARSGPLCAFAAAENAGISESVDWVTRVTVTPVAFLYFCAVFDNHASAPGASGSAHHQNASD